MDAVLQRTILDRLGALLLALGMGALFVLLSDKAGMVERTVLALLSAATLANLLFVLATPIARRRGGVLYLYSEVQPVVFDLRPRQVDLSRVSELVIDKRTLYPRAIFRLPHGVEVFHAFPMRSERRIQAFLRFIGDAAGPKTIE